MTNVVRKPGVFYRRAAGLCLLSLRLIIVLLLCFFVCLEVIVRSDAYPTSHLRSGTFESTRIFDDQGNLLREFVNKDGHRAHWRPLNEIPSVLQNATIAVEDRRFYHHEGVDWTGVLRAVVSNTTHGRVVSGASTITMQLARMVRPHEGGYTGKMVETVDALRLERSLSKQDILEHYLNRAPYGAGTVGVEAASQRYFGRSVGMLSLAEAALLAGLPASPNSLNPLRNPNGAKKRQRKVLRAMHAGGFISKERMEQALNQQLSYVSSLPTPKAMHVTDWILKQGARGDVHTTISSELQEDVASHLQDHLRQLADRGATHAAVVVLDNATCAIKAMVGSGDYWNKDGGAVNGALALRQPGSTLKPFTYTLAFEQGFHPGSVVADIPAHYAGAGGGLYSPRNYEDRFSGPVLMGNALGKSLNVPAVRLAGWLGVPKLLKAYRDVGLRSLRRRAEHYGLGLTLGNGEVNLLELTEAYAALARQGVTCRARIKAETKGEPRRVFSAEAVALTDKVLKDESLRIEAFGPNNALILNKPVAVKTGTSSDWRDNWAMGYTDTHTIGVWLGDTHGRTMQALSGVAGAGPLFRRVLESLVNHTHDAQELTPSKADIAEARVCALSGKRPSSTCPHTQHVPMPKKQASELGVCSWHKTVRVDVRNQMLAGPGCSDRVIEEKQIRALPPEYAQWEATQLLPGPPSSYSPLCPLRNQTAAKPRVTFPGASARFAIDPGRDAGSQRIRFTAEPPKPVESVSWVLNGEEIGRSGWPYAFTWQLRPGEHTVEAVSSGIRSEKVKFLVL